jgi:hypothetical protein
MALKKKNAETKETSPYMNEAEQEALQEQIDEKVAEQEEAVKNSTISMERIQKAVAYVEDQFHLSGKGYIMTAVAEKGSGCVISLSNERHDIAIKIKDLEAVGII